MTYMGKDGKQYVAITAGGHGTFGTHMSDYVMRYMLEDISSFQSSTYNAAAPLDVERGGCASCLFVNYSKGIIYLSGSA
ncbi:hypothetical protein [Carnimonas nigrificans]|uniref:hypothetical protein n=1 Tax=Carnimonas nigrificans TaxID=64323 RepID=UPI000471EB44|nr:hypothetical protein [Carnimonas nigrificans]